MAARGNFSRIRSGTKPVKPCWIGVMPKSRSRATICLPSAMRSSMNALGRGPPKRSMFVIHCQAK